MVDLVDTLIMPKGPIHWRHGIQDNDIQDNDTQHNDTQY
jgi:hypothetical protein